LCVADLFSTDAYVVVHMGGKEVHRTKHVWKDLNPIWTIGTGSLFLITFQSKEDAIKQLGAGGLSFTVEDYDALGKNDVLGRVTLPLDELLKGKGERTGYKLEPTGKKCLDVGNGMLYLRFKIASKEDKHFIQMYHSYKESSGMHLVETYVPMRYPKSKFFKSQRKLRSDGEKLLRVKPFPDPLRKEQTKWMTTAEIEAESIKESTNWIEAGSGDNGKGQFIACIKKHIVSVVYINEAYHEIFVSFPQYFWNLLAATVYQTWMRHPSTFITKQIRLHASSLKIASSIPMS